MAEKTLLRIDRDKLISRKERRDSSASTESGDMNGRQISTKRTSDILWSPWPSYIYPAVQDTDGTIVETVVTTNVSKSSISCLCEIDGLIACGADDGSVTIFSVDTSKSIKTQKPGQSSFVSSLIYNPKHALLLAGYGDGSLSYMSMSRSVEVPTISISQKHQSPIWSIDSCEDYVVTGSMDQTCRMIDLSTTKTRQTFKQGHVDSISVAKFFSLGNSRTHILTGSSDKTVALWDMRMGNKIKSYFVHSPVADMTLVSDVFAGIVTTGGHVLLVDIRKGVVSGHEISSNGSAIERLGSAHVAVACNDGKCRIMKFDSCSGGVAEHSIVYIESGTKLLDVTALKNGTFVASSSSGNVHQVYPRKN
jgi:WD40 repeat protein